VSDAFETARLETDAALEDLATIPASLRSAPSSAV
jgi:hypothetical protein